MINNFVPELDIKYDLPGEINIDNLITDLNLINCNIISTSLKNRNFTYLDTKDYKYLNNGDTLRIVGGFDPDKGDGKNNYRYDLKTGDINNNTRKELSIWNSENVDPKEIFKDIDLGSVDIVAKAPKTQHFKIKLEYKNSKIEISIDEFNLENGKNFKELEIELIDGEISDVVDLGKNLELRLGLFPVNIQKYERVINIINKTKELANTILDTQVVENAFKDYEKLSRILIEPIEKNNNFIENPDDPNEHHIGWHQFGILSHSKKVYDTYQNIYNFIEGEENKKVIESYLNNKIDGVTKRDLLGIALIYHDVGKFKRKVDEKGKKDYDGHEEISKQILLPNIQRDENYKDDLDIYNDIILKFNLNENHMKYIADCAGLHYELGKFRNFLKNTGGYTIENIQSGVLTETFNKIDKTFPEYYHEIGILFLSDSIGKTDIVLNVRKDNDIEKYNNEIEKIVKERNLPIDLLKAIKQLPINITLVNEYIKECNNLDSYIK